MPVDHYHGLSTSQWQLFFLANWATAAAYTYIPLHLQKVRLAAGKFGSLDQRLFEYFVFWCGVHHWFHPVAMVFDWWWPAIGVDMTMAAVSVLAAGRLWYDGK